MLHSEQRPKKRYKFRNYEFWASYGKVAILDTENYDPKYNDIDNARYISPGELIKRAMAIRVLLDDINPEEGRKLLEDAVECAKEAAAQGDISNMDILRKKAEDLKPTFIWIPSNIRLRQEGIFDQLRRLKKISEEKKIDPKNVFAEGYNKYLNEN